MITTEQLWGEVRRYAPEPRQQLIPRLLEVLESAENPLADFLLGKEPNGYLGKDSAEALERVVLGQYGKKLTSKMEVADCLRLLHSAEQVLIKDGIQLETTRLADLPPPRPSPFNSQAMRAAERVAIWRQALSQWIKAKDTTPSREDWQVALVLSAILHGFLLDTTKIKGFVDRLSGDLSPGKAAGYLYLDFDLPYQGMGNHHLQRWFLDPLSEMLWNRMPAQGADLPSNKLRGRLRKFLRALAVPEEFCPSGLGDLVSSASTWWSFRSTQIDLHAMRRFFSTHSIHQRSWQRFFGGNSGARRVREAHRDADLGNGMDLVAEVYLLHPWLQELCQRLESDAQGDLHSHVQQKQAGIPLGDIEYVYLDWLLFLLGGNSASKDALSYSTIRKRYLAAAPALLSQFGHSDPREMETRALEDIYCELTLERDPGLPIEDLAKGIADFHAFLVKRHGKTHIGKVAEILGDAARLMPVDANLITFDDYRAAWKYFDERLAAGGDADDITLCKLVMTMAFKLGMRRMEIFGLRLEDIQIKRGMVCLVREHAGRRLKTSSSRRLIPMIAFLDWRERKLLRRWYAKRVAEEARQPTPEGSIKSEYLFAVVDGKGARKMVSVEGIVDRIIDALRRVTGDGHIFLHHLRHAFGTWTFLRLRAPSYPLVAEFFKHLPETARAIHQGQRLRRMLLGARKSPTRVFAYAVALLLGHSSPAVSMGHYVHSTDVFQAALVYRESAKLSADVLVAASGLAESTARSCLALSTHQLVRTARRRFKLHRDNVSERAPLAPREPNKRGRPTKLPAHLHENWLPINKILSVLHLCAHAGQSPQEAANQLGMTEQLVRAILLQASKLSHHLALPLGKNGIPQPPTRFRYLAEKAFAKALEEKLAGLANRSPQAFSRFVAMHLQHYNRQKHDVVFRDAATLSQYISYITMLGLGPEHFILVVRKPNGRSVTPPPWVAFAKVKCLPARVKRISPQNTEKETTYARMLGFLPVDEGQNGLGQVMAKVVYFASLSGIADAVSSIERGDSLASSLHIPEE